MSYRDRLGPDYPAYFTDRDGTRMPLEREGRWTRTYRHPTKNRLRVVSRFRDGSATISANELRELWPKWTLTERRAFVHEASNLHGHSDFPEIFRFLIERADGDVWSAIARSVALSIPQREAFYLLSDSLAGTLPPGSANIVCALALTRHPSASEVIRTYFETLWVAPQVWLAAPSINAWAFTVMVCIQQLIELGMPASRFEEEVRALSHHQCAKTRQIMPEYLGLHYPWLRVPVV